MRSDSDQPPFVLDTYAGNADIAWVGANYDLLAVGSDDGTVLFWTCFVENEFSVSSVRGGHENYVSSVSTCPTIHNKLVSSSWDSTIKIWNCESGACEKSLSAGGGPVHAVAWEPSAGSLIAAVSQSGSLRLFDTREGKRSVERLAVGPGGVGLCSVAWNPLQHDTLAVGGEDSTVRQLDIRKASETLSAVTVHKAPVRRLAYSPHNPALLATASDDCTARVISVENGITRTRLVVDGHKDFVRGLAFHPQDKSLLVTGSWDRTTRLTQVS
mmetsp:Transcript_5256/g.8132  ORF Transcript_5256/g.8132 Transcript_5256/m.8132 type:complete len:271 (-) Transcript_5256:31-843(-)